MASNATNKTPNYGLSQWVITDKVRKDDFNSDNQIIDTALAGKFGPSTAGATNWDSGNLMIDGGQFTTNLEGVTTAGTWVHANNRDRGSYRRIGNICIVEIALAVSSWSGVTGLIRLKSLPFPHVNNFSGYGWSAGGLGISFNSLFKVAVTSGFKVDGYLYFYDAITGAGMTSNDLNTAGNLYISGNYIV